MRKIAFGYSTRCNIRCSHCVAAEDEPRHEKMALSRALEIIREMGSAGVQGISFTAGEPFIFFSDLQEMIQLCSQLNIYTRVVTNSYWASSRQLAKEKVGALRDCGLSQMRLSYSRWHQQHVVPENIVNAADCCKEAGIDYYVSFVTDFSKSDEKLETYLRQNCLKFFPEPVIYAGRADSISRQQIRTDYQDNRCSMNPYLAPDLNMYGCCDAGSHFTDTNFFLLGNLNDYSVEQLFSLTETSQLYNCIRNMGISTIASYAGLKSRDIITYRKCELCKELFNSPKTVRFLQKDVTSGELQRWSR